MNSSEKEANRLAAQIEQLRRQIGELRGIVVSLDDARRRHETEVAALKARFEKTTTEITDDAMDAAAAADRDDD